MKIKLPLIVIKVLKLLTEAKFKAYVVGGAIRDIFTGTPVKDWDFTTDAKPEEVLKLFKESYYDNRFGTVGVAEKYLGGNGESVYEITTFRTESEYTDHRRPNQVTWGKTLTEDLKRRDFTINAMALDINLKLFDPFKGQTDLNSKLIRCVGDPNKRFSEDALRMMRAIRIAAQLGFSIETKTLAAINKNSALIKQIAWERIRDELLKILASPYPKDGILLLFSGGLLQYILPEMLTTRGVEQAGHHTKDVWLHSLDSLAGCPSPNPIIRLAALIHDLGKPTAKKNLGPDKTITFYNHEVIGSRMAKIISQRLRLSKKDSDLLWLLVRWHMFAYEPKMTDKAIRRFIHRIGKENIDNMIMLRIGDRIGGGSQATSWRLRELQERIKQVLYKPFEISDLKIDGNDVIEILNLKPGPKIGLILKKLFDEVLEDSSKNDREYLLKRTKELNLN